MDDSISRRAAIDVLRNELKCVQRKDCDRAVCKTCDLVMNEADIIEALTMAIDVLTAQPEIIRCKDCLMHGICRFEQGLGLNGYCSQAERRTDEDR